MQTKICTKCKRELPISQFQADKRREFGVGSHCKDCKHKYRQANKARLLIAQYKRRINNPDYDRKQSVWRKVYYALKVGKITKPRICSICRREMKIQSHHEDYNKPFEITWCCQDCHVKLDNARKINHAHLRVNP